MQGPIPLKSVFFSFPQQKHSIGQDNYFMGTLLGACLEIMKNTLHYI